MRSSTTRRWGAGAYLAMAGAGAVLAPSLLSEQLGWAWSLLCACLVLGGLVAGISRCRGRWPGELAGVPLLASSFAALAGLQLAMTWGLAPVYAAGNAGLLLAVSWLLVERWAELRLVAAAARREARA